MKNFNITIRGQSEYDFGSFDFGKFKFDLGHGRVIYYCDQNVTVNRDDSGAITVKLSNVPIDVEGKTLTLVDIEMNEDYDRRIVYPMFRIDDIKTNAKSVKARVKLDEEHDQYIVYRDEEPYYDDPEEVYIVDGKYIGIGCDLRFCATCTHIKTEEYLKYIKYICFRTGDVEYRYPVDIDKCTVPDYIEEEREDYPRAVAFDFEIDFMRDTFDDSTVVCDIIFADDTPSCLKFNLDDVLLENGCSIDIRFNKNHDPHIAYVD